MTKYLVCLIMLVFLSGGCTPPGKAKRALRADGFCFENKDVGLGSRINLNGYYWDYDAKLGTIFLKDGSYIEELWIPRYKGGSIMSRFSDNNTANWGTYRLEGDTIKAGFIYTRQPPWCKEERWYRIIDKNTIETIAYFYCIDMETSFLESRKSSGTSLISHFVPYDSLSGLEDNWIKHEKWFWCDKAAYKAWAASKK